METPKKVSSTLLERLRKDTEHADVDLAFEGGIVLTAHACVLALTSDYYKEALSTKWAHGREVKENLEAGIGKACWKVSPMSKERQASTKSPGSKITLNHPYVDANTAKIVLDFLYLGDVEIPPSLISSVIAFADEILVVSLVQKCVNYLVNENKLSLEYALECYAQFDRVNTHVNIKSYALSKMLQNLPLSLECGRVVLAQMNERDVERLLLFEQFEPLDRWRILIAWCRACQDTEGNLSLESKLADNFPIEAASKLIKPLLPGVELFKIPHAQFNLLEPFQLLLPESVWDMLEFHLKGTTRSGGNQWKARHQNLTEIMRAIKQHLPVCLCSHNAASEPVLLFHGKPGESLARDLYKACHERPNTLTLVKIKNGNIFGRFFVKECHIRTYGLDFGSFMKDFVGTAEMHKDIFPGIGDGEISAFSKQLPVTEIDCDALVNHTTHAYVFESSSWISRQGLIKLLALVVLVQTIVTVADATSDSFKLTSAVAAGTGSMGSLAFEILNCWNSRSLILNPKLGVNYWSLCSQSVFVAVSVALYASAHIAAAHSMDAKNVLLLAFSIVMEMVLLSTLFNSYDVSMDLVLPYVNEKCAGLDKLQRVEIVAQKEMSGHTVHHETQVVEPAALETPLGVLEIHVQEGRNLRNVDLSPVWAETFQLIVYPSMLVHDSQLILKVSVFDANETQNDKLMGSSQSLDLRQWLQLTHGTSLPLDTYEPSAHLNAWNSVTSCGEQHSWKPLYKQNGGKTSGEIRIGLEFAPVQCTNSESVGKGKGVLGVIVHGARNLRSLDAAAVSCQISLIQDEKSGEQVVGHTSISDCSHTPVWEYAASAIISDSNASRVRFRVMDDSNLFGLLTLNLARIIDHLPQNANHDQLNNDAIWHALQGKSAAADAPAGLRLTLRWFPLKPQTSIQQLDLPAGMARIKVLKALNLKNIEIGGGKSDPFARISIGDIIVGETQVLQNSLDPIWNETFYASIYSIDSQLLQVQVWDSNSLTSDGLIGTAEIPLLESLRNLDKASDKDRIQMEHSGTSTHVTAPLFVKNQTASRGTVILELEFYSADSNATIPALSLEDSELVQRKTSETEDAVLRLTQSYENGVLSREDMQGRVDRIRQKGYVGNVDAAKAHLFHRIHPGTAFEQC
ncbi:hypothetical protein HDU80_001291, partial [Chytriomyces hyalinus]